MIHLSTVFRRFAVSQVSIIQISDIHLTSAPLDDALSEILEPLLCAVRSEIVGKEGLILLYTGDLSFSGKTDEFTQCGILIDRLYEAASNEVAEIAEIFIPGNHDCDRAQHDSLRSMCIESPSVLRCPDEHQEAKLLSVQAAYRNLCSDLSSRRKTCVLALDRLYEFREIQIANRTIAVHLLNSAWASHENDQPGGIVFPEYIDIKPCCADADVAISVMHHPWPWYAQSTRLRVLRSLEGMSDFIFTGHEHVSDEYSKSRKETPPVVYLEAQALNDPHGQTAPGFNVVTFGHDGGLSHTRRFVDDDFVRSSETHHPVANPEDRRNWRPLLHERAENFLDDPGTDVQHPALDSLRLQDIYIYPSLREVTDEQGKRRSRDIKGENALEEVLSAKKMVITGNDRAGKTALVKSLTRDFAATGRAALAITSGLRSGEGTPRLPVEKLKLRQFFNAIAEDMYIGGGDGFFGRRKENRVLIIDDMHRVQFIGGSEEEFLTNAEEMFGAVILIASPDYELIELLKSEDRVLGTYSHFQIQELGHVDRSRLVRRWERHKDTSIMTAEELTQMLVRKESRLTMLLGRNLLPYCPLFALIILQRIDEGEGGDDDGATLGRMYEYMISGNLLRHATKDVTAEDIATFTAELAHHMLIEEKWEEISRVDLRNWAGAFCKEWNSSFAPDAMIELLCRAGILDERNELYYFRRKYVLQYFAAKCIANHLSEGDTEAQTTVYKLAERLFDRDAANVMVFLAYMSRARCVLDSVIQQADRIFSTEETFDISSKIDLFTKLNDELPKLELLSGSLEDARKTVLEAADSAAADHYTVQLDDDEGRRFFHDYSASYVIVQLGGQILRGYHGTMRGPDQERLMSACYRVGLRSISAVAKLMSSKSNQLFNDLARAAIQHHPAAAKHEVISNVSGRVSGMLERTVFNMVKAIGDASGSTRLEVTMNNVVNDGQNLSFRTIELASRLDHYQNYPEKQALELLDQTKNKPFALSIVRDLLWLDFHLLPRDYKTRQKICKKAEITIPKHKFLNTSRKRRTKRLVSNQKSGR
jgi:hypothetical protein